MEVDEFRGCTVNFEYKIAHTPIAMVLDGFLVEGRAAGDQRIRNELASRTQLLKKRVQNRSSALRRPRAHAPRSIEPDDATNVIDLKRLATGDDVRKATQRLTKLVMEKRDDGENEDRQVSATPPAASGGTLFDYF